MSATEPGKGARSMVSVATPPKDREGEQDRGRVSAGISDFDLLIEGGFPKGKSYLIVGEPGSGKSIFCMHFVLKGLMDEEKVVYVPADEKPPEVVENAASLGWDLRKYVNSGQLLLLDTSPSLSSSTGMSSQREIDVSKVVADLASYVKRAAASRLVIDPVGPLIASRDSTKGTREAARTLIRSLQDNLGTTNLLTLNASPYNSTGREWEDYPVNGVLLLSFRRKQEGLTRTLLVSKMRATALDLIERQFSIVKGSGIVIGPIVSVPTTSGAVVSEPVTPPTPKPTQADTFFKEWQGR